MRQICPSRTAQLTVAENPVTAQAGQRGYQERSAPPAIPATARQADGRAMFMCRPLGGNARTCRCECAH
jgi:hypothetical protein